MSVKRGAPTKPPELRKSLAIQIRLTETERADCDAAAASEGMNLSAWARTLLVVAAKRYQQKQRGRKERD